MALRCFPLLQNQSTLQALFTAMILRLAYDASHCSFRACNTLLAQLWQIVPFFWSWARKTKQLCFVRRNSGETYSLPRAYFHPFKAWLRHKLKHITVLSIFILPHLYRSGNTTPPVSVAYLPLLNCCTASKSRSKNIRISSGSEPARNRRTIAMRVLAADLPCVLLPVLFLILP